MAASDAEESESPAEIKPEEGTVEEKPGRAESVPEVNGEPSAVAEQVTTPVVVSETPVVDEPEPERVSEPDATTAAAELEDPDLTENPPTAEERTEPTVEAETTAGKAVEEKEVEAGAVAVPEQTEPETQASTATPEAVPEDDDPEKKPE